MRGLLVCVCGPDASGKTTAIKEFLKERPDWEVVKFPNRSTAIGDKIDRILKGEMKISKEAELKLFADNRSEFRNYIFSKLSSGVNVILDRYVYCSAAYNSALQFDEFFAGKTRLMSKRLSIENIIRLDRDNYKPDLAILAVADYSASRNVKEKYDCLDRNVLVSNYIQAFIHTGTPFCVLDESISKKIDKFCDPNNKLVRFL